MTMAMSKYQTKSPKQVEIIFQKIHFIVLFDKKF